MSVTTITLILVNSNVLDELGVEVGVETLGFEEAVKVLGVVAVVVA